MIRKMTIALRSTDEVREFVREVMPLENEYDLISGKYVIDAKSILGIFWINIKYRYEDERPNSFGCWGFFQNDARQTGACAWIVMI